MPSDPSETKAGPNLRSPRSVINEAIRETAAWDTICRYGVVLFGLTGVVTILGSLWAGSPLTAIAGAVPTGLCWPCIRYASTIKRGNVALRMLELALDQAKSAEQAYAAINKAFESHYVNVGFNDVVR